jgi:hypothetical protein
MDDNEKMLAFYKFKLKIYESKGEAFEDFFIKIMRLRNHYFKPVKPRGHFGDRKNDGFDKKHGKYYQVFAPLNPVDKFNDAVKKCRKDFEGLYKHWNSISTIREYYFVLNDKYNGTDAELEKELSVIKSDYNLEASDTFLNVDLERELFKLDETEIRRLVGSIPKVDSTVTIRYTDISEVLNHIINYEVSNLDELTYERDLEFEQKLSHNSFSEPIKQLLRKANYQIFAIEDFFKKNAPPKRALFAKKLKTLYKEVKLSSNVVGSDQNYSDMIFMELLEKVKTDNNAPVVEASLAVLSYYFETCDIFETV